VDPDVTSVVTVGHWKADTLEGLVRVVVRTGGFEHVASSIQVEWVTQSALGRDPAIVAVDSTLPIPDRMYSLGVPEPYSNFDGQNFLVCGTQAYDLSKQCWRFWVGTPGRIELVNE
jgi:hypothetical protein